MSGIVDRLAARGVVQRQPDATDRRFTRIALTDALARKVPALIGSGPGSRMIAALEKASPEERRTMLEGLTLLQRYLSPTPSVSRVS